MNDLPSWALGLVAFLTTFGPGAAAFLFARWWSKRDKADEALKLAETEKLDQVLAISRKLESDVSSLSNRLSLSDALQNQLKGSLEKVEERINGITSNYGRRLGEIEEQLARIDERTRDAKRRR